MKLTLEIALGILAGYHGPGYVIRFIGIFRKKF